ncbi:DoxX family protein [Deminuibacter soli]|uniref:DoxX family protein n=1 Tax=Deminuibacter soli TaxID=2291815 RepID=A0A3E1NGM1_9BACT|nr:DoxX family protein [Deminuibacter soli]RFM26974.1 DoxX family protein [Deminuibacter soli]
MKRDNLIYWIATSVIAAVMTFSVVNFTFNDHFLYPEGAFKHLGLPGYFKIELTIAKTLGILVLLAPGIPVKLKEFAYAGFAITLVSGSIAHGATGDRIMYVIDPLLFLGVLSVSYYYFLKRTGQLVKSSREAVKKDEKVYG